VELGSQGQEEEGEIVKRRALRRRYGRAGRRPGVSVTKVYPFGRGRGVGTRVVLEDGWTMTFVGPVAKGVAIRQAEHHRSRGTRSER
jgi:hypothetical protein